MDKNPPELNRSDIDGLEREYPNKLRELRELIVGPERKELDSLKERLSDPSLRIRQIGEVLPDAIVLQSSKDDRLTKALAPTVDRAVHTSVRKNPKILAQALFPAIGPAIRKSISDTLGRMVQSLNQTLEHSLSIKGLKWRLEAWRTGQSFGEIVLLHTLQFRVEQIFLIHLPSGVLIAHKSLQLSHEDPDLVSAMLTAIQDFVKDSFSVDEGSELQEFQVGDLAVWIEHSHSAVLAAVIRGNPPLELRSCLRSSLEQINRLFAQELDDFDGDSTLLRGSESYLEDCLIQREKKERKSAIGTLLAGFAAALLILVLGIWFYQDYHQEKKWNRYLNRLNDEPGIVVTSSEFGSNRLFIQGLKDPLSANPATIRESEEISPDEVSETWEAYLALDPRISTRRSIQYLNPPDSVEVEVVEETLRLSGFAPQAWITASLERCLNIPGIRQVNTENLTSSEVRSIQDHQTSLHSIRILFDLAQSEIKEEEIVKLEKAMAELRSAISLTESIMGSFEVEIVGHADPTGSESFNQELSQRRATSVRSFLVSQGIPSEHIRIRGAGSSEVSSGLEPSTLRSVTFNTSLINP